MGFRAGVRVGVRVGAGDGLPHGMGHLLVEIGADDVAELLVRDTARVVLVEGAEELAHLVRARIRIKARVST